MLIIKLLHVDEPYVSRSSFDEQKIIIQTLREEVKEQQETLAALSFSYQKSHAATFQKTLIEQEQSYQEFLVAMKVGMFDLAKMVQGSRTWLDVYNEKLDDAQDWSELREKELESIKGR